MLTEFEKEILAAVNEGDGVYVSLETLISRLDRLFVSKSKVQKALNRLVENNYLDVELELKGPFYKLGALADPREYWL